MHEHFVCWRMLPICALLVTALELMAEGAASSGVMDYFYWYWEYVCSSPAHVSG